MSTPTLDQFISQSGCLPRKARRLLFLKSLLHRCSEKIFSPEPRQFFSTVLALSRRNFSIRIKSPVKIRLSRQFNPGAYTGDIGTSIEGSISRGTSNTSFSNRARGCGTLYRHRVRAGAAQRLAAIHHLHRPQSADFGRPVRSLRWSCVAGARRDPHQFNRKNEQRQWILVWRYPSWSA